MLDARVLRTASGLKFKCRQQYLDKSFSDWEADVVVQAGGQITLQRGQWADARGPFGTFSGRLLQSGAATPLPEAQRVLNTPPRAAPSQPVTTDAAMSSIPVAGQAHDYGSYGGISLEEAVGDDFEAFGGSGGGEGGGAVGRSRFEAHRN